MYKSRGMLHSNALTSHAKLPCLLIGLSQLHPRFYIPVGQGAGQLSHLIPMRKRDWVGIPKPTNEGREEGRGKIAKNMKKGKK